MSCSICCLIYQSIPWLNFVYHQVLKYTDLKSHEFFFVANDATEEVLTHLQTQGISHYHLERAPGPPDEWYINQVYRGYNFAATKAVGEFLVFINSDMAFSPGWLECLIKYYNGSHCISSRLVEAGRMPSGEYGIERNFGHHYLAYNEPDFIKFAVAIREDRSEAGGLYMPLLVKATDFNAVGGYPEGNLIPGSNWFDPVYAKPGEPCIPGDLVLMYKLATQGIHHLTAFDSIVYHFQRGESDFPTI